jgi:hypothetical protein
MFQKIVPWGLLQTFMRRTSTSVSWCLPCLVMSLIVIVIIVAADSYWVLIHDRNSPKTATNISFYPMEYSAVLSLNSGPHACKAGVYHLSAGRRPKQELCPMLMRAPRWVTHLMSHGKQRLEYELHVLSGLHDPAS